jgi:hypothetical protein
LSDARDHASARRPRGPCGAAGAGLGLPPWGTWPGAEGIRAVPERPARPSPSSAGSPTAGRTAQLSLRRCRADRGVRLGRNHGRRPGPGQPATHRPRQDVMPTARPAGRTHGPARRGRLPSEIRKAILSRGCLGSARPGRRAADPPPSAREGRRRAVPHLGGSRRRDPPAATDRVPGRLAAPSQRWPPTASAAVPRSWTGPVAVGWFHREWGFCPPPARQRGSRVRPALRARGRPFERSAIIGGSPNAGGINRDCRQSRVILYKWGRRAVSARSRSAPAS